MAVIQSLYSKAGCKQSAIVRVENVEQKKGRKNFSSFLTLELLTWYESCSTAPSPLIPPSLASSSILRLSRAAHGRLISICFTEISHNSSVAAAVPGCWARRSASRLAAALALVSLPALVGFSVGRAQTLSLAALTQPRCHCADCYVLSSSFSTHFVSFQGFLTR